MLKGIWSMQRRPRMVVTGYPGEFQRNVGDGCLQKEIDLNIFYINYNRI